MLCLWDTRNLAKPIFENKESASCIMRCDFTNDQKAICSSTLEGVINVTDIASKKQTVKFDTLHEMTRDGKGETKSNICYTVRTLKNHPDGGNKFAIGADMRFINTVDYDVTRDEDIRLQTVGKFVGHFNSVRHIESSPDYKYLLSSSEDHSIFLWDTATFKPVNILAGHTDLAVSHSTLKAVLNSLISIERGGIPQQRYDRKQLMGRQYQDLEV